jgi:hypothetical protein
MAAMMALARAIAGQAGENAGHLDEQCVAGSMAEHVVDVLEAVEIDEQQTGLQTVDPFVVDGVLKAVAQQHAIGQAGQGIVLGVVADDALGAPEAGDIGDAADDKTGAVGELQALLAGDDRANLAVRIA